MGFRFTPAISDIYAPVNSSFFPFSSAVFHFLAVRVYSEIPLFARVSVYSCLARLTIDVVAAGALCSRLFVFGRSLCSADAIIWNLIRSRGDEVRRSGRDENYRAREMGESVRECECDVNTLSDEFIIVKNPINNSCAMFNYRISCVIVLST